MKQLICFILLLVPLLAFSQPAPILRNLFTTNLNTQLKAGANVLLHTLLELAA